MLCTEVAALPVSRSVGAGSSWLAGWLSARGKLVLVLVLVLVVGEAIVVARKFRLDVSAEGGGGRGAWRLARQRKHSPVPK